MPDSSWDTNTRGASVRIQAVRPPNNVEPVMFTILERHRRSHTAGGRGEVTQASSSAWIS